MESKDKLSETEAFAILIEKRFPDLSLLIGVLGKDLPRFLEIFEGRVLTIPTKASMRDVALAAEALYIVSNRGLEACLKDMSERYGMPKQRVYEMILSLKEEIGNN